jgi:hypothetical protein
MHFSAVLFSCWPYWLYIYNIIYIQCRIWEVKGSPLRKFTLSTALYIFIHEQNIIFCLCMGCGWEFVWFFKDSLTFNLYASCWNIAWFKTTVLRTWYKRESLSLMLCERINTMIKHKWQLTHIVALPRTFNLDPEVEGAGKKKNAIIYYIVGFVYKTYR